MKMQPMNKAPKDRPILLKIEGEWIEGEWIEGKWQEDDGKWFVVTLPSHGCGCCSDKNKEPTGWAELPKEN